MGPGFRRDDVWIPPYQVRGRLGQARNDKESEKTSSALHEIGFTPKSAFRNPHSEGAHDTHHLYRREIGQRENHAD